MKILMVSDVYFPRINGVSTSIKTFRSSLIDMGHEVTLIAPDYGEDCDDDEDIIRIPSRRLPFDPEDRMMRQGEAYKHLPHLIKNNYDVVHIQTPFVAHYLGIKLGRTLEVPTVVSYHTYFEEYLHLYIPIVPRAWLRFIARAFSRQQCRQVEAVIVPSEPMQLTLKEYGVKKETRIIPTGLKLDEFASCNGQKFKEDHNINLQSPTLVHIGRIAHEKNIDFLLHVTQRVKQEIDNIHLIIAGEGPATEHLKQLSKNMGIENNLTFVGYLSREDTLLNCYCAGDCFVFSSRTETQGLVLLEAMALGVPVVSTAYLGTKDILRAEKGAIIAEEDVTDFSNKVIRMICDKTLRDQIGEEAKEYAKSWSTDVQAKKLLSLYQNLNTEASTQIVFDKNI